MLQIRRDVAATKNVAAIPNLYTGTQSYSFLGGRHVLVSLWEGSKRRIAVWPSEAHKQEDDVLKYLNWL